MGLPKNKSIKKHFWAPPFFRQIITNNFILVTFPLYLPLLSFYFPFTSPLLAFAFPLLPLYFPFTFPLLSLYFPLTCPYFPFTFPLLALTFPLLSVYFPFTCPYFPFTFRLLPLYLPLPSLYFSIYLPFTCPYFPFTCFQYSFRLWVCVRCEKIFLILLFFEVAYSDTYAQTFFLNATLNNCFFFKHFFLIGGPRNETKNKMNL